MSTVVREVATLSSGQTLHVQPYAVVTMERLATPTGTGGLKTDDEPPAVRLGGPWRGAMAAALPVLAVLASGASAEQQGQQQTVLYRANFSAPLHFVTEGYLSNFGPRRVREPDAGAGWVLESGTPPSYARGEASARSDASGLTLENRGSHLVFWRNQVSHGP
jgi:hypothetical protein